jgi:hypothetical protein
MQSPLDRPAKLPAHQHRLDRPVAKFHIVANDDNLKNFHLALFRPAMTTTAPATTSQPATENARNESGALCPHQTPNNCQGPAQPTANPTNAKTGPLNSNPNTLMAPTTIGATC